MYVEESDAARTAAQSYFFAVDEDKVLDPTTRQGVMEDSLSFLGLLKTDTLIARINEPPLGGDVNLCTEIASNGVTVIAERDIFANGTSRDGHYRYQNYTLKIIAFIFCSLYPKSRVSWVWPIPGYEPLEHNLLVYAN